MTSSSRLHAFRQRGEDAPWEVLYFSEEWQPLIKFISAWTVHPVTADSGNSVQALDALTERVGLPLPLTFREWYRLLGNHPLLTARLLPGMLSPAADTLSRVYTGHVILPVYEPRSTVLGVCFRLNGKDGDLYFGDYDAAYFPAGTTRQFEDCFHPLPHSFEQLMLSVVADCLLRFAPNELLHDYVLEQAHGVLAPDMFDTFADNKVLLGGDMMPRGFWPLYNHAAIVHPRGPRLLAKDRLYIDSLSVSG